MLEDKQVLWFYWVFFGALVKPLAKSYGGGGGGEGGSIRPFLKLC